MEDWHLKLVLAVVVFVGMLVSCWAGWYFGGKRQNKLEMPEYKSVEEALTQDMEKVAEDFNRVLSKLVEKR